MFVCFYKEFDRDDKKRIIFFRWIAECSPSNLNEAPENTTSDTNQKVS